MKNKLAELQLELKKMGLNEEFLDIQNMLRILAEQAAGNSFGLNHNSGELDKWREIIEKLDSPGGYRVEALHELANNVTSSITNKITPQSEQAATNSGQIPTSSDRQNVMNFISSASMQHSGGITKTASEEMINGHIALCNQIFKKEEIYFLKKASISNLNESEIQLLKEAGIISSIGRAFKGLGRGAMRALPVLGLAISLPLAGKNIWEAYQNGKAIISELPLDKYGISLSDIASGATGASAIKDKLRSAVNQNQDNPDNILEIVEILKTTEAFYLDFLFAITNSIMAFVDAATVVNLVNPLGGPIWSAILGIGGLILTIGLVGLEWKSESISEEYWRDIKSEIKSLATSKLQQQNNPAMIA